MNNYSAWGLFQLRPSGQQTEASAEQLEAKPNLPNTLSEVRTTARLDHWGHCPSGLTTGENETQFALKQGRQ
jgi:hypothetical protein